jgi:hypothetical protein
MMLAAEEVIDLLPIERSLGPRKSWSHQHGGVRSGHVSDNDSTMIIRGFEVLKKPLRCGVDRHTFFDCTEAFIEPVLLCSCDLSVKARV